MRRALIFQLILTFFGLSTDYRKHIFDQIHEIVFFGQGGYSYDIVYNMPLWLRKYTYHQIKEYWEKIAENKKGESVEEFTNKVKTGAVQVPSYARGNKINYNGGTS